MIFWIFFFFFWEQIAFFFFFFFFFWLFWKTERSFNVQFSFIHIQGGLQKEGWGWGHKVVLAERCQRQGRSGEREEAQQVDLLIVSVNIGVRLLEDEAGFWG